MIVRYSPSFLKKFKSIDVRIRKSFKVRITIFYQNPTTGKLNNHQLKREWKGHRSIDITADWRAIYKEIKGKEDKIAYFVAIGTHKELYKNI